METLISYSFAYFIPLVFFQMKIDKSNLIIVFFLIKSVSPIILFYFQLYHFAILNLKTQNKTKQFIFAYPLPTSFFMC